MKNKKLVWIEVWRTVVAISVSLLIIFAIVLIVSKTPLQALSSFLLGPFSSVRRIGNVIELMVPLMFTGLATVALFRVGLFNLSVEGSFFIGSVVAAASAVVLDLPPVLNLVVAMSLAALAGGIVTSIPAILKVKCNANVIVTSLMLNYVMLNIGLFITSLIKDPKMSSNYSYMFDSSMILPKLINGTRINAGIIIIGVCLIIAYLLFERTSFGFKASLVGNNEVMARYSGVKIAKIIFGTQLLGGLIAGLGGSVELFGMYRRFQYQELTGYGWDGILVAIVARHNVKYVPLAALFLAFLRIGADIMSRESDVPFEIVKVIQAIIIVMISAQAILSTYRKKVLAKETKALENMEVIKGE